MKSRYPFPAALALAASLLAYSCTEGTSSGWDNPSVQVAFVNASGNPQKVSGELQVFADYQDPAVFPFPLARVRVLDAYTAQLTQKELENILGEGVTDFGFNLVFAGDSSTGAIAAGLRYASGLVTGDGVVKSQLEMTARPLIRYQAKLALQPVHGDLGRVYIPGTAFQATLDAGSFTFEGLPGDKLSMILLNGSGDLFTVPESLDTHIGKVYTPSPKPSGTLPGGPVPQSEIPRLEAGAARETTVGAVNSLGGDLTNADSTDARLSILWRQIGTRDSVKVRIANPTRLKTSVTFTSEGVYLLEVNVTLLKSTARDTLTFTVHPLPAPKP